MNMRLPKAASEKFRDGWDRIFAKQPEPAESGEGGYECLACFDRGVIKVHAGLGYETRRCKCRTEVKG